jgi:hypothetical protein
VVKRAGNVLKVTTSDLRLRKKTTPPWIWGCMIGL